FPHHDTPHDTPTHPTLHDALPIYGGGDNGGGAGGSTSGVTVQYIDARADILLIKYKGRTATVPAYPTGSGRYIPAFSPSGSGDGGGGDNDGGNGGGGGGTFTSPAEGEFTSDYGPRDFPSSPFHAGVDIANAIGTNVYAALAGTVIGVGANLAPGRSGDRNVLIESSDGQGQYYGHLNSNSVSVGDTVTSGQHIAEMGARGNVTGPHLHFETWADA